MRIVLLAAGALGLAWLVTRRQRDDARRVVVTWRDGSELELRPGSSERERLVAIASEAIR